MKELFASADAGIISLLFFFIFFTVIAVWAYRPSNREQMEAWGRLPFEDDQPGAN